MKSTHHRNPTAQGFWAHLSEIPAEIREVLDAEVREAEAEDQFLLTTALNAIRQAQMTKRVPNMCQKVLAAHPEMRKRKVFTAVSLVTGMSEGHIRDLFYAGRKKP